MIIPRRFLLNLITGEITDIYSANESESKGYGWSRSVWITEQAFLKLGGVVN